MKFKLIFVFLILISVLSYGQRGFNKARLNVEIIFDKECDFTYFIPPTYSGVKPLISGRGDRTEWLQLLIKYKLTSKSKEPLWIDELTFDWCIFSKTTKRYILSKKTVTYLDVSTDKSVKYAAVYIRPQIIKRYFDGKEVDEDEFVVRIQPRINGKKLGEPKIITDKKNYSRLGAFWTYEQGPKVNVLPNGLLNKQQTPFAPIDTDIFQFIKPSKQE
ncbi:MAG: hypothetical protein U9O87_04935 [Verrucomicrobiota bacterium]|nr:hypothetical protein [Verrucomicrobiota bacterium]